MPKSSRTLHPNALQAASHPAVPPVRTAPGSRRWLVGCVAVVLVALAGWAGVRAWSDWQTRRVLATLQPVASSVPANQPERRAAMELADGLLRDYPRSAEALYARGLLLLRHGFNDEAVKTWNACLRLVPNLALAYEFLGIEASQRGADEEAVKLLQKAVAMDPQSPAAGLYLGETLNNLGRMDEAIPVLEQFIHVSPHSAEPYFQLGQAYMYLQNYRLAKESHQRALREDPGFAQACFALAQACERLGETEAARRYREQHLSLISQGRMAEQGRTRSGRSATEAKEALANAYVMVGKIHQAHGRADEAEACWRKAAAIGPAAVSSDSSESAAKAPGRGR